MMLKASLLVLCAIIAPPGEPPPADAPPDRALLEFLGEFPDDEALAASAELDPEGKPRESVDELLNE